MQDARSPFSIVISICLSGTRILKERRWVHAPREGGRKRPLTRRSSIDQAPSLFPSNKVRRVAASAFVRKVDRPRRLEGHLDKTLTPSGGS